MQLQSLDYRKITAKIEFDDGNTVDLVVDLARRRLARQEGYLLPTKDYAYGPPEFGRLAIGNYGEDAVLTDCPVNYMRTWIVIGLDDGQPIAYPAQPLMANEDPTQYAAIADFWK